uniref:PMS1 homolog 1, mismatch repair system component n=1 Tax=Scleropages formosus TaxID=113540 RepID=A0A8C9VBR5_SCLFO
MRQLPADTVRLLSSSQIVTCVSNVVKELVENSLDAGASSIEVKLENFGLDRLEVRDNGSGIKAVDAPVMALKHYTSKICCHDDLERLETYGFRGEALGSICAVAEVTVTTKTVSDKFSTQYTLNHTGHITSQKPSHLGQGTTVCVLKLFKNLPVRRQLYSNNKKCKEELKKAQDLLMAYGIIKPELRILLTHNKAAVWQKAKVPDHRTALMAVLGTAPMANMVPLQHHQEEPEVTIEGYFPKRGSDYSLTSSSNCDRTFIFINDRPVRHKEILKVKTPYQLFFLYIDCIVIKKPKIVLRQQYSSQVERDVSQSRYPILMMSITVPAASVDVNVTPDKTHVMLHNKVSPYWVVDSIPRIPDLNLSLTDDDSILDALGTADFGPAEDGESPANAGRTGGVDTPEISAESWSRGHGLLDPDSREPLVPVKVCVPGATETEGTECEKRERMSSGVGDKASKLTAYDLISSCAVRRPLSASAIFEQEARAAVLRENPTASPRDIAAALEERWKNLGAEGRKKYEEKAEKELNRYNLQSKKVSERVTPAGESEKQPKLPLLSSGSLLAQKRKASFSQQQLDQLFSQPPKKKKTLPKNQSTLVPFSLEALRRRLTTRPVPCSTLGGLEIVGRLSSHGAWLVLRSHTLMLLNPSLLEEALLFNRLLETNVLPAASLCTPVQLTEGLLGGPENTRVLCDMQKETADLSGATYFSDPRLVANGFRIRLTPGSPSTESHLEVVGMADCVPFFGVADLREILTAIVKRNAATVKDCRPLKVHSFLEGEAVRLARQLPLRLSREDVRDMLSRKERQLSARDETCLHGRPFLHPLADVPETDFFPPYELMFITRVAA